MLTIKVLEQRDATSTGNRLLIGYFMVAGGNMIDVGPGHDDTVARDLYAASLDLPVFLGWHEPSARWIEGIERLPLPGVCWKTKPCQRADEVDERWPGRAELLPGRGFVEAL
jgi:hypothetical protein